MRVNLSNNFINGFFLAYPIMFGLQTYTHTPTRVCMFVGFMVYAQHSDPSDSLAGNVRTNVVKAWMLDTGGICWLLVDGGDGFVFA